MTSSDQGDHNFSAIFSLASNPALPYTKTRIAAINKNRGLLDQSLFFDLLLQDVASIENATAYYPPSNINALRDLYEAISKAKIDTVKKTSLLYYILKDWSQEAAQFYLDSSMLPESFSGLIDAFYALDNLLLEDALHYLCLPSLNLNYNSKILSTFLHGGGSSSTQFAVQFVNNTGISDDDEAAIWIYFKALLCTSIEAAFLFQRTLVEETRSKFFEALVNHSLSTDTGIATMKLLNLPLNANEEKIFKSRSQSSQSETEQDTIILRKIYRGHLMDASEVPTLKDSTGHLIKWANVRDGIQAAIGSRKYILDA